MCMRCKNTRISRKRENAHNVNDRFSIKLWHQKTLSYTCWRSFRHVTIVSPVVGCTHWTSQQLTHIQKYPFCLIESFLSGRLKYTTQVSHVATFKIEIKSKWAHRNLSCNTNLKTREFQTKWWEAIVTIY